MTENTWGMPALIFTEYYCRLTAELLRYLALTGDSADPERIVEQLYQKHVVEAYGSWNDELDTEWIIPKFYHKHIDFEGYVMISNEVVRLLDSEWGQAWAKDMDLDHHDRNAGINTVFDAYILDGKFLMETEEIYHRLTMRLPNGFFKQYPDDSETQKLTQEMLDTIQPAMEQLRAQYLADKKLR